MTIEDICVVDSLTKIPLLIPYVCDISHPFNMVSAAARFACDIATPEGRTARCFKKFFKHFIKKHFLPRSKDGFNFQEYLAKSNWSGARKNQLDLLSQFLTHWHAEWSKNKSFIKLEPFDEPKGARGINSYSDEMKIMLAELFNHIDKSTFASETQFDSSGKPCSFFVKGSDPATWPEKLKDMFGWDPVMISDFSSFEAHHHDIFSEAVKYWMIHMMKPFGFTNRHIRLFNKLTRGENFCEFKGCTTKIAERLMSGALWTSSANGVLNLLILSFLFTYRDGLVDFDASHVDSELEKFKIFVEGDDAIATSFKMNEQVRSDLGLKIGGDTSLKISCAPSFGEAAFCQIYTDVSDMTITCDPMRVLRRFPLLERKYMDYRTPYKRALMRAKAMCYKYRFPHAPVVGAYMDLILRLTKHNNADRVSAELGHMKHTVYDFVPKNVFEDFAKPTEKARLFVEKQFGFKVDDQLALESIMDNMTEWGPICYDLSMYTTSNDYLTFKLLSDSPDDAFVPFVGDKGVFNKILNTGSTDKSTRLLYKKHVRDAERDYKGFDEDLSTMVGVNIR